MELFLEPGADQPDGRSVAPLRPGLTVAAAIIEYSALLRTAENYGLWKLMTSAALGPVGVPAGSSAMPIGSAGG